MPIEMQVTQQDWVNIGETLRGEIRVWQRARQEATKAKVKAELLIVINSLKGTLSRWEGRLQLEGYDWHHIRDALRERIECHAEEADEFAAVSVRVLMKTLGRWEQHKVLQ
jgi:hypothetical protein